MARVTDLPSAEPARPRVVTIAFWTWMFAAVLLVLLGMLSLTVSADAVRAAVVRDGATAATAESVLTLLRGVGVLSLVVGGALGYLTGRAGRGDRRFRRAAAALGTVFAFVLLGSTLLGLVVVPILGLAAAIALLTGTVLMFRPPALDWFDAVASARGGVDGS